MKKNKAILGLIIAAAAVALAFWFFEPYTFKPSRLFGDHAVLQRGKPVPVWGWGKPGSRVWVKLAKTGRGAPGTERFQTVVDGQGNWRITLPPHEAGGPYRLTITGQMNHLRYHDVQFGDVWLCAGQSNMDTKLRLTDGGMAAAKAAAEPLLRMMKVKKKGHVAQQKTYSYDRWDICGPDLRSELPALPYYFGKSLHEHFGVPIGLVAASMPSSRIEAWMPASCFEAGFLAAYTDTASCYNLDVAKQTPTCLYNTMVHPVLPFPIKGIVWWQGESNTEEQGPYQYSSQLECLVENWRKAQGDSQLPFILVQLSNIGPRLANKEAESDWPRLREAQLLVSQKVSKASQVVIFDICHPTDIHPSNKKEVAERLALAARGLAYGEDVVYEGPVFQKMEVGNGQLRLHFGTRGNGLVAKQKNGVLKGFKVAGSDRRFFAAEAIIEGETVVVRSKAVPKPVAARYAWERSPLGSNLCNGEGLPASPFRTDDW